MSSESQPSQDADVYIELTDTTLLGEVLLELHDVGMLQVLQDLDLVLNMAPLVLGLHPKSLDLRTVTTKRLASASREQLDCVPLPLGLVERLEDGGVRPAPELL